VGKGKARIEITVHHKCRTTNVCDSVTQRLAEIGVDYAQGYGIATPQRIVKIAANG
jgi:EAL domain-containing protein (putative c-di-GMP-specific phosphodiesterase class I)